MKMPLLLAVLLVAARSAAAQPLPRRIEGHLGFVHPFLTVGRNGLRSPQADGYLIGFPTGISVRQTDRFAFDLELVPFVRGNGGVRNLLVHPGLLWGLTQRYTLATRAAFELAGVWGFTPSLTRSYRIGRTGAYADLALPLRWGGGQGFSVSMALHLGVGF